MPVAIALSHHETTHASPDSRIRAAVSTLRQLPRDAVPPECRAVVPLSIAGSARAKTLPSADEVATMMATFIAAAVAIPDQRERVALFLAGGYSLRRSARILCCSHVQVARLRSLALLRLSAYLLTHDEDQP
jgi:hypothetical protein